MADGLKTLSSPKIIDVSDKLKKKIGFEKINKLKSLRDDPVAWAMVPNEVKSVFSLFDKIAPTLFDEPILTEFRRESGGFFPDQSTNAQQQAINRALEKPVQQKKTVESAKNKGVQAKLLGLIDTPQFQNLVEKGIAPKLTGDQNVFGRLGAIAEFPLQKVLSILNAYPRATSAFTREIVSQAKGGIESGTFFSQLFEPVKQGVKSFYNTPGAKYKNEYWADALREISPSEGFTSGFAWTEDQDDWIKGTNWIQKIGVALVGSPADIVGLGLDIALDPLTYITGGLAKGARIANIAEDIITKTGTKILPKGSTVVLKKAGLKLLTKETPRLENIILKSSKYKSALKGFKSAVQKEDFVNKAVRELFLKEQGAIKGKGLLSLVDTGGLKLGGQTVIPGFKLQKTFGKSLEKIAKLKGFRKINEWFNPYAGVAESYRPVQAYAESVARAIYSKGIIKFNKILKSIPKAQWDDLNTLMITTRDIKKLTKRLAESDNWLKVQQKAPGQLFADPKAITKTVDTVTDITRKLDKLKAMKGKIKMTTGLKDAKNKLSQLLGEVYEDEIPLGYKKLEDYFPAIYKQEPKATGLLDDLGKDLEFFEQKQGSDLITSLKKGLKVAPIEEAIPFRLRKGAKRHARIELTDGMKQFGVPGKELFPRGTTVFHGTSEEFADAISKGVKPGIGRDVFGHKLGNRLGFSVSTESKNAKKFGDKVVKFTLSPNAKIATPDDFPQVFKRFADGDILFDQAEAVRLAKEAGFDGVDLQAFEKLTVDRGGKSRHLLNEIQIFNPDVLTTGRTTVSIPEGYIKLKEARTGKAVKELKGWYFPEEFKDVFMKSEVLFFGDESAKNVLKFYDKGLLIWKRWALASFGYHFRNFYSDMMSGTMEYGLDFLNPKHWADYFKLRGGKAMPFGGKQYTFDDFVRSGIDTGQTVSEAQMKGTGFQSNLAKLSPAEWSLRFGQKREGIGRGVAAVIDLKKGTSLVDAAFNVKKVFFDYLSLTAKEKRVMKRFVPFYTWMRKNLQRQIELVATRTGGYASIPKFLNYLEETATTKFGQEFIDQFKATQPEHFKKLAATITAITDSEGNPLVWNPNLPFQDWSRLTPKDMASAGSPILKIVMELGFNKDIFFDSKIYRSRGKDPTHPYSKAPKWLSAVVGKLPVNVLNKFGFEKEGDVLYISDKAAYALRQIPPLASLSRVLPASETPSTGLQALSLGLGAKFFPFDPEKEKAARAEEFIGEVSTKINPDIEPTVGGIEKAMKLLYEQTIAGDTNIEDIRKLEEVLDLTGSTKEMDLIVKLLKQPYEEEAEKIKGLSLHEIEELLESIGVEPKKEDIMTILQGAQ